MNDLAFMAAAFLLPLVVAFGLFYFIPAGNAKNTADFHGKIRGLKIKASGAIGGYLIVLVFAIEFANSILKSREAEDSAQLKAKQSENEDLRKANDKLRVETETWKIYGWISLGDQMADPQKCSLVVVPPKQTIYPDGHFTIEMRIPPSQAGPRDIPEIVIGHEHH